MESACTHAMRYCVAVQQKRIKQIMEQTQYFPYSELMPSVILPEDETATYTCTSWTKDIVTPASINGAQGITEYSRIKMSQLQFQCKRIKMDEVINFRIIYTKNPLCLNILKVHYSI